MSRRPAVLISAAELAALLESAQQPVVADVRWTLGGPPGKPQYEAGHIPGAVWVDLESHLAGLPGAGGRHPLPPVAVFEQAWSRDADGEKRKNYYVRESVGIAVGFLLLALHSSAACEPVMRQRPSAPPREAR